MVQRAGKVDFTAATTTSARRPSVTTTVPRCTAAPHSAIPRDHEHRARQHAPASTRALAAAGSTPSHTSA